MTNPYFSEVHPSNSKPSGKSKYLPGKKTAVSAPRIKDTYNPSGDVKPLKGTVKGVSTK